MDAEAAASHPFYWGRAHGGRFIGAYVLRLSRRQGLACVAGCVIALLTISRQHRGTDTAWSLAGDRVVQLIMFPTIFYAAMRPGERAAEGSGVICMRSSRRHRALVTVTRRICGDENRAHRAGGLLLRHSLFGWFAGGHCGPGLTQVPVRSPNHDMARSSP